MRLNDAEIEKYEKLLLNGALKSIDNVKAIVDTTNIDRVHDPKIRKLLYVCKEEYMSNGQLLPYDSVRILLRDYVALEEITGYQITYQRSNDIEYNQSTFKLAFDALIAEYKSNAITDVLKKIHEANEKGDIGLIPSYYQEMASILTKEQEPELVESTDRWNVVNDDDVREAIKGSYVEDIVNYQSNMIEGGFNLDMVLGQALATVGCFLSRPLDENFDGTKVEQERIDRPRGGKLASVQIKLGHKESVPNIMSLLVADSGEGKSSASSPCIDLLAHNGLYIGSGGTSEGLMDAIIPKGCGVIKMSELKKYMGERSVYGPALDTLVDTYHDGFFQWKLATKTRVSDYCFPTLIAEVQPEMLKGFGKLDELINTGFFSRCITIFAEPTNRIPMHKPVSKDSKEKLYRIGKELSKIKRWDINFDSIPFSDLEKELSSSFKKEASLKPIIGRLVNVTGPKLCAILQCDGNPIREDTIKRVEIILLWILKHTLPLLNNANLDFKEKKYSSDEEKVLSFARKNHGKITKTMINNYKVLKGKTPKERSILIDCMLEDNVLRRDGNMLVIVPQKEKSKPKGLGIKFESISRRISDEATCPGRSLFSNPEDVNGDQINDLCMVGKD